MGFNCGIVGLPNVGKSTLFNALTSAGAQAANYPFCTIDPNVGIVQVPDKRLDALANMVKPRKVTPTSMEFVDIAGLVKGASRGEGLGNQFLAHIREVDAIVHVVRCFEDDDISHVEGSIDPARDIETIETELALADLETVEKQLDRTRKMLKSGDGNYRSEYEILAELKEGLNAGKAARNILKTDKSRELLRKVPLLTAKPVLYAANVGEEELTLGLDNPRVGGLREIAEEEQAPVVVVSAQVEAELVELNADEKKEFLGEYGLQESGLERLVNAGYKLLGLITFFTAGEPEVRAWTITEGAKAPKAAGKIHTDIERGFIRAEVIDCKKLLQCGGMNEAKEKGLLRLEGKDYVMRDGDVVYFRFNV